MDSDSARRPEPTLEFSSEEEFAAVCEQLAGRLHWANRVYLGESGFAWEVAELLARLGHVFAAQVHDPATRAEFGDGYRPGTLPRDRRAERLLELLREPPR